MFFSASIAFTLLLSLSATVSSAPLSNRAVVAQVCSGSKGTGACTPLNIGDNSPADCTEIAGVATSLILNVDNSCVSFQNPGCSIVAPDGSVNTVAREHFSDDAGDLEPGVRSISCSVTPGLVNGLFPQ
ncbi:hypothetical protein C8J57DRAFT_1709728 [Mycena rebaudengoi]|nr:hypothetical protein C8J57DRAFT_1709728 [Mycena rebaudengoi]